MARGAYLKIDLESIRGDTILSNRKTRIVCTLGPACWSVDTLVELIDAGMSVARFNFSHGDHTSHHAALSRLNEARKRRPNANIAVMLDTKGPEIRTGFLEAEQGKITLEAGQEIELTTDYSFKGNNSRLAVSYTRLPQSVKKGDKILVADGVLVLEVKECRPASGIVLATVLNSATIGERKNVNLPGVIVDLPTVTKKDIEDILKFGCKYKVDMIAASFIRKSGDICNIRKLLDREEGGSRIKVIAKIENQEGLENFQEILRETDGIMVARGDLGMEIPPQKVFLAQKMMIRACNLAGKTVITATQMLESMCVNPRPTRAECTDVANAVLDGADCVMLSGETAGGKFPVEAVRTMAACCVEAEGALRYDRLYETLRRDVLELSHRVSLEESVAMSAVGTALEIGAKCIVVLTQTGNTARLVAKYRPQAPILVLTPNKDAARVAEGLVRGATARVLGAMIGTENVLKLAGNMAKDLKWINQGDLYVCIHGQIEGITGKTNTMQVLTV